MNKKMSVPVFALVFLLSFGFAIAQESEPSEVVTERENTRVQERMEARQANIAEKKQQLEEKRAEISERRCETAQKRIQNKNKQLQNNLNMHTKVHERTTQRLTRLSDLLLSKELNTTDLNKKIAELSVMTGNLQTQYAVMISSMQFAEDSTCEATKENFKAHFELAKENLGEIKVLRAEIRTFINNEIKPELQTLRAQLEDEKTEIEDEEKDKETEDEDEDEKEGVEIQ